ncbi:MAG TPA: hypothetical protein VK929_04890 [Longimicrobiales bacterium]|nr:hypothetical protein [Longimicrobiales bacterium]
MRKHRIPALLVASTLVFAACDASTPTDEGDSGLTGTYALITVNGENLPFTVDTGETCEGQNPQTGMVETGELQVRVEAAALRFTSSTTVVFESTEHDRCMTSEQVAWEPYSGEEQFRYTYDAGVLTVIDPDWDVEAFSGTVAGNEIHVDMEGLELVFRK